jgi:hypothetical protein
VWGGGGVGGSEDPRTGVGGGGAGGGVAAAAQTPQPTPDRGTLGKFTVYMPLKSPIVVRASSDGDFAASPRPFFLQSDGQVPNRRPGPIGWGLCARHVVRRMGSPLSPPHPARLSAIRLASSLLTQPLNDPLHGLAIGAIEPDSPPRRASSTSVRRIVWNPACCKVGDCGLAWRSVSITKGPGW